MSGLEFYDLSHEWGPGMPGCPPAPGRAAPGTPSSHPDTSPGVRAQAADDRNRLQQRFTRQRRGARIADLRDEMQKTMEQSAGIYRSGDSLSQAADTLHEL